MGLRMEDLHNPTVGSGPTSGAASNGVAKEEMTLTELIAARDRVQSELSALGSVLDSHKVDMHTSLTTFDGFPRDDIGDIAQIRTTRARIIHLRNDWKDLMKRIENALHELHATNAAAQPTPEPSTSSATASSSSTSAGTSQPSTDIPFAKVNSVVPSSPAQSAGLQLGDEILKFGAADWMNHEKLSKVAQEVSRNEGRSIPVKVSRTPSGSQPQILELRLVPRSNWGGRGMLGCHLLPL